jgi:guanosine-3',5'-bis(diphosphate) 3'-pyrophosphohydrolase
VRDTQTLIAAILHDTIEDTPTTHQEVKENFGEDVLSLVLEVTDDKSLEKIKRKRLQVSHAPQLSHQARMIKIADKLVNCGDILVSPPNGWSIQRRREYIQWGADVVSQIRGTNPGLEAAFDHLLKEAEEQLDFSVQPFDSIDQRPWGPE